MIPMELPLKAEQLIPQRGKMKLIDQLVWVSAEEACAETDMSGKKMFLTPSRHVLPSAIIELAAQSTACFSGYIRLLEDEGSARSGYLVGLQDFVFDELPCCAEKLSFKLKQESSIGFYSLTSVIVFSNDTQIATGLLKTWEEDGQPQIPEIDTPTLASGSPVSVHGNFAPIEKDILRNVQSVEKLEHSIKANLCYRPDFKGFDGHFEAYPVLPGILILQTVETLCESLLKRPYRIMQVSSAKFAHLSFPGEMLEYDIKLTEIEDDRLRAVVRVSGGTELKARFTLDLAETS